MMKRTFLTILALIIVCYTMADEWVGMHSSQPGPAEIRLISSNIEESLISFKLQGFYKHSVNTPQGNAFIIRTDEGTPLITKGCPDVAKLTASVIIPDRAQMRVELIESRYHEYYDIDIAPSRGHISRENDPSKVPYVYGKVYSNDGFYPGDLYGLREPHILRDYRGQTVIVYPFQYNPVKKILRVYDEIRLRIYRSGDNGENALNFGGEHATPSEFRSLYSSHFLNASVQDQSNYDPLDETGNMLVIAHPDFIPAMQDFVNWKKRSGMPVEMVNVNTIGGADEIKTYVENYYNEHGLAFLLLVGDNEQVPTHYHSGVIASDNSYGYILGDDSYPEVIVGRFSAETIDHVNTQVIRSLAYEQNPSTETDWFSKGIGIGSKQGPGDDNELDYEHIRNMQTDLLGYTYTSCSELFDGSQGGGDEPGNPNYAMVKEQVETGAGHILYTGHGSTLGWGTTGFNSSHVDALNNATSWPFIWSVACSNGNFYNTTCFAESWLRACDTAGNPSGALATLMSSISQDWDPPMEAQDEMVDILVETYEDNIKRSFGGISVNGFMKMIDSYGNAGAHEADAWTIFGDPSISLRTQMPQNMSVSHTSAILLGSSDFTVNCNIEGARVCISIENEILAYDYIQNGSVILHFDPLIQPGDMNITVTAFNTIPYIAEIPVQPANGPYIIYKNHDINDLISGNANLQADFGESFSLDLRINNIGNEQARDVDISIVSEDTSIMIQQPVCSLDSLGAGEGTMLENVYEIEVHPYCEDLHIVPLRLEANDGIHESWTSYFNILLHSAVFQPDIIEVNDETGNNNGRPDPGESFAANFYIRNTGSAPATNVTAVLLSDDSYITITENTGSFGNVEAGMTASGIFSIEAADEIPAGHEALLQLVLANDYTSNDTLQYKMIIGQIPALVLDLDGNHNSGTDISNSLETLGISSHYLTEFPPELDIYSSVFVCLGVYFDNYILSEEEGQLLADYLIGGGNIYLESGDTWFYNPETPVHPMFKINGITDGSPDLSTLVGMEGTFTEGQTFVYSGDNNYIDHISPLEDAFLIMQNTDPEYGVAVAYEGINYRTIGTSFEFGGLNDGIYPSTKDKYLLEVVEFFRIDRLPLGSISGMVKDETNGEGIPYAKIEAGGYVSFADGEGNYSAIFPTGEYELCITAEGYKGICDEMIIYEDSLINHNVSLTYLLPPINLNVETEENQVQLSWELESLRPLDYFNIYRNTNGGHYELLFQTTEYSYTDIPAESGLYSYFVKALYDGIYESISTDTITIEYSSTGIIEIPSEKLITRLKSNYPNPFSTETHIRFSLSQDEDIQLYIMDFAGQVIRQLASGPYSAGDHEIVWNAEKEDGQFANQGVYFCVLLTENKKLSRKLILMY